MLPDVLGRTRTTMVWRTSPVMMRCISCACVVLCVYPSRGVYTLYGARTWCMSLPIHPCPEMVRKPDQPSRSIGTIPIGTPHVYNVCVCSMQYNGVYVGYTCLVRSLVCVSLCAPACVWHIHIHVHLCGRVVSYQSECGSTCLNHTSIPARHEQNFLIATSTHPLAQQ